MSELTSPPRAKAGGGGRDTQIARRGTVRRDDRLTVPHPTRPAFGAEADLESYLVVHLALLTSILGQDLLVIGRQVKTVGHGDIDLLAIDATGVIYIIELKLREASPSIIAQVLDYRRWIKGLNREKIIRLVADGDLNVDLVNAFPRRFGHPLPEAVNESQVLMIVAASIHRRTAHSILELKDCGFSMTTFRYVVQSDTVSLIPCVRDDQDVEALHAKTMPPAPREGWSAPAVHRHRVHIDDDTRQFWQSHAPYFTSPIVLSSFVYEQYKNWVRTQAAEELQLGLFSRQLARIIAESGEWTRVLVAPGNNVDVHGMLIGPLSTRASRVAGHRIVAYLRSPVPRHKKSNEDHVVDHSRLCSSTVK